MEWSHLRTKPNRGMGNGEDDMDDDSHKDVDCLLDIELSHLRTKPNGGVGNRKDDIDTDRHRNVDSLLDMELGLLSTTPNRGLGNRKDDMDNDDGVFDEIYLAYLLGLEKSAKPDPVEEHRADPEYVMFLENLKEHGNSYMLDLPIEEDVADPEYVMFFENLKEHANSYVLDVPAEHGVPLCIMYEEEEVHFDDVMKRKIPKHGCEYNIRKERNNAKKTNRRSSGVPTTHIKRNRGESMKRKFLCSSSDEYLQGERNIAEKNYRRNVSSYGVRNTLKKRTSGENRRKNSHYMNHAHIQEKRNIFLKNNRRNVRFYGLSDTEERTQGESVKGKNSCSPSDSYAQAERNIAGNNNRRNVRSYGVSNTLKKKTRGESTERKISHSTSHVYIQERRNIALKNNKRNVGSCGVNSAQKARTCGKGMKRNKSRSSTNGCYVQDVRVSDSIEAKVSNLQDSDFYNRMAETLDKKVQEKGTVGEVIKKRKLMSHTGNHIEEEKHLNVSTGKQSGVEGAGSIKIITKPHSFDHFQGKQTTEKNNPISVSFADFQEKEKTEKKIPISPNLDNLKEDQCVNVIDNSRSTPKNSSFQKSVVNEVYDLFLKNLSVIRESVVYKFGDNERVFYELSSDRCLTIVAGSSNPPIKSDLPIKNNPRTRIAAVSSDPSRRKIVAGLSLTVRVAIEKQPTHPSVLSIPASRSTIPPLDKQLVNSWKVPHRVPSNMRKRLLVILSRPYSKQEHEQLWKEVSFRSAVLTHRDSRSGGSHRPGQMGRSLLDWNPDLSSEIDKVKSDPLKVLNLLRMLSFYIKKLPCGNICKPWMDDSLMTIIHESA